MHAKYALESVDVLQQTVNEFWILSYSFNNSIKLSKNLKLIKSFLPWNARNTLSNLLTVYFEITFRRLGRYVQNYQQFFFYHLSHILYCIEEATLIDIYCSFEKFLFASESTNCFSRTTVLFNLWFGLPMAAPLSSTLLLGYAVL